MLVYTDRTFDPHQHSDGYLLSYSRPCPPTALIDILRLAQGQVRLHWENTREPLAFAGFGTVAVLTAAGTSRFRDIEAQAMRLFDGWAHLGDAPDFVRPRIFGGFAFRPDHQPDAVWSSFAAAQFVLPRCLITQHDDDAWMTLNAYVSHDVPNAATTIEAEFDELFDQLFWDVRAEVWNPEWEVASKIEYPMSEEQWARIITSATNQMHDGPLKKVVLARMAQIEFNRPVNVIRALEYLREPYARCYRFLFEPQPHHTFYGATPELLVRVDGRTVEADALAGSIKRGVTPDEDAALKAQILADPKERQEHDLVVAGLRERLGPWTDDFHAEEVPGILELSNIQHLFTPVQGNLSDDYSVLRLLEELHPTPALGGQPYELAQSVISKLEPITRGWYAAPVGWIDYQLNGMFAVGIRAAATQGGRVWAYAGAGIVAESVPEKEWAETDLKFRPMLNALGIDHARAKP